jgi:hypothetical protein
VAREEVKHNLAYATSLDSVLDDEGDLGTSGSRGRFVTGDATDGIMAGIAGGDGDTLFEIEAGKAAGHTSTEFAKGREEAQSLGFGREAAVELLETGGIIGTQGPEPHAEAIRQLEGAGLEQLNAFDAWW